MLFIGKAGVLQNALACQVVGGGLNADGRKDEVKSAKAKAKAKAKEPATEVKALFLSTLLGY